MESSFDAASGEVRLATTCDKPPMGICGSSIFDAVGKGGDLPRARATPSLRFGINGGDTISNRT